MEKLKIDLLHITGKWKRSLNKRKINSALLKTMPLQTVRQCCKFVSTYIKPENVFTITSNTGSDRTRIVRYAERNEIPWQHFISFKKPSKPRNLNKKGSTLVYHEHYNQKHSNQTEFIYKVKFYSMEATL